MTTFWVFFSYQPSTSAALGQWLSSKAWPDWVILYYNCRLSILYYRYYTKLCYSKLLEQGGMANLYYTTTTTHNGFKNKSLALHPIASKMFEQNSCFALKMFEQNACFALKIFEQKFIQRSEQSLPSHPKCLNKSLVPKMFEKNVPQQSTLVSHDIQYMDMYVGQTLICWYRPGNARLHIACL